MKNLILIILFVSSLAQAQNNPPSMTLGEDKVGGKVIVEIVDGPIIFSTKICTQNAVNPSLTTPLIILSAFDVCNGRDLVPRFLDTESGKANGAVFASRSFKCVGGDLDDWKRLLRLQCVNLKPAEDQARMKYCSYLGGKLGDGFVKCKDDKCESVQDSLLAQ
jgi:hypothetical protein